MNQPTPSNQPRSSRLDSLLAKRALIERQLKAMASREAAARRKAEQRAKFVLGQAVLSLAAADPALLDRLCSLLSPKDQALVRSVSA